MSLQETTWQTVGPYFRIGFEYLDAIHIAPPGTAGVHVTIEGRVLDGNGKAVPDAVIEVWQADAAGHYSEAKVDSGFSGFGRIPTDAQGRFCFATIQPGPVPGPDGKLQSPHLAVRVMMRGLLKALVTRMYFPCESVETDPVLNLVPGQRRGTLIATPDPDRTSTYSWNVELQGERETVFFDC